MATEQFERNCREYVGQFRDPEKAREAQRKGVAKQVESRRRNAIFRRAIKQILEASLTDSEMDQAALQELAKLGGVSYTQADAIALAMSNKAKEGDVNAATFLRDTVGEKPVQGVDLTATDGDVEDMDLSQLSDAELNAMISERQELPEKIPDTPVAPAGETVGEDDILD